jgi:hypothetical protein
MSARNQWKLPRRQKKALIKRTNAVWYRCIVRAEPSMRREMLAVDFPDWFHYSMGQPSSTTAESVMIPDEHSFVSAH